VGQIPRLRFLFAGDFAGNLFVGFGIEVAEGEVFEFRFHPRNTQAVG
jgi:hypothetical protein